MGLFRRTETAADDNDRTRRLLDHADDALEDDPGTDFADVLMEGLYSDVLADPYPPSGHGYPRRRT